MRGTLLLSLVFNHSSSSFASIFTQLLNSVIVSLGSFQCVIVLSCLLLLADAFIERCSEVRKGQRPAGCLVPREGIENMVDLASKVETLIHQRMRSKVASSTLMLSRL